MYSLSHWKGVARPARIALEGRYARLEPLTERRHGNQLLSSAQQPDAEDRFRYLTENPPTDADSFRQWLERAAASEDPLFFAVIDQTTKRAEGRQALMRIDTANGVVEVGRILWGPAIARTRVSTEALYLFARYVFDDLGYRRFEWKCDNRNEPSKRAAVRFGFTFEGVFRCHMVAKGQNRDTAWFAMIDADWRPIQAAYLAWLASSNFDEEGRQKSKLVVKI